MANTGPRRSGALEEDLRRDVGGEVRFDSYSRALYSTDASIYQMEPIGVVIPRNADDIAATVDICARAGVPVLPRGGGTSLSGQTVNHAVVMDFTKYMNAVVETNVEENWVMVQPGITLEKLNRYLRPHGLHFPPDPTTANRATVGGAIGNNSCGAHSILYGKTSDHVKQLAVVLSDATVVNLKPLDTPRLQEQLGHDSLEARLYRDIPTIARAQEAEIARRFPDIMRRVSGYNLDLMLGDSPPDLSRIIVGSEGTLCTVTEAMLNLEPLPKVRVLAILHFDSLVKAMEATTAVLEHDPAAVELVDRMLLERAYLSLGFARRMTFIEGNPEALMLVEFFGESDQELRARMDMLEKDMSKLGLSYACVRAVSPEQQADAWAVREAGLGLLMSVKGDTKPLPFVEDTAVSPEMLPDYVRRFDQIIRDHNTTAAYYGHASVGCLHVRPMVNIKVQQGLDTLVSIAEAVSDLVLEFGGSNSGEHGDGIVRGVFTEKMFGHEIYEAFRAIKQVFDPNRIMNPGKIIDCPPITHNLRLSPTYKTMDIVPILDFTGDGGFGRAVELCNGVGACRKDTGTMCPSYMVTREEEHSTRGRSNVLRSVLSGVLPTSEFTGKRLRDVLDLCLECKGCKAECPSNVDMAKLKYEFLAHYNRANGIPLRARLFANIAKINHWSARFGWLANFGMTNFLTRWLLHGLLGIHWKRRIPRLARETFSDWFRRRKPLLDGSRGPVVLFNDTFMNYNNPQVGRAAVELLEGAGYNVIVVDNVCCGRPMISKGMLERARDYAQINVDLLYPFVKEGIPIVGCEPSCLLTLSDEYPDLLRSASSEAVAQHVVLLDKFLLSLRDQGQLDLKFREHPEKVLFQGHCHQKALVGTAPSLAALRMVPSIQVEEIDAGCCGMAGAFGYEKEHYDLSMAIGEREIFPAIRAASDARIVATGFSCRHQITDGTGRHAQHLVEFLREALL